MNTEILETELSSLKDTVKIINSQIDRTVEIVQQNEINLVKLETVQKLRGEQLQQQIEVINHDIKKTNKKIAIDQEKQEKYIQEIKNDILSISIKEKTKSNMFKWFSGMLMIFLTFINIIGILYDRIVDHGVKIPL